MRIAEISLVPARLLLASVFLLAGVAKIVDPGGTRKALRDFGSPVILALPILMMLPVLELAVAAALIPARLAWYGAWGALGLLIAFLIAVGISMLRGRRPDCHCYGQLHAAPIGWPSLVRNGLLAVCAWWITARGQGQSGPDVWAWLAGLGTEESKLAIVVACLFVFLIFRVMTRARSRNQEPVSTGSLLPSWFDDDEALARPIAELRAQLAAVVSASASEPASQPSNAPASAASNVGVAIGTPAPEFKPPTLKGETHSLK
jgi:hypothetical protein